MTMFMALKKYNKYSVSANAKRAEKETEEEASNSRKRNRNNNIRQDLMNTMKSNHSHEYFGIITQDI